MLLALALALALAPVGQARAEAAGGDEAVPPADAQADRFPFHGQTTYVWQRKPAFLPPTAATTACAPSGRRATRSRPRWTSVHTCGKALVPLQPGSRPKGAAVRPAWPG
ncbi:hypothetical protein [Cupriavidus sp. D39]|uniref:hypothetical protein n=1 Tax=Cupriavidus sp. D39 TaxID=2997877 RepID=UPI003B64188E